MLLADITIGNEIILGAITAISAGIGTAFAWIGSLVKEQRTDIKELKAEVKDCQEDRTAIWRTISERLGVMRPTKERTEG